MTTDACVLVVDDVTSNRRILIRQLEKQGVPRILEAGNGQEALDILETRPVDLVLLDVMMPEVDGYEVLGRMKGDSTLRHLPVIMITALDDMDSAVQCIEAGAEDYVLKPFNSVLLRARISACLEKKRLLDVEREYLRRYDAATGLPNQGFFLERLAEELGRWQRHPSLFGVLLVRLDRYRMILDSLGQRAGDEFALVQAKRLARILPGQTLTARLSPNEFAVLLTDLTHAAAATAIARQIHHDLGRAQMLKGHEVSGRVRVGVALSSTGYSRPENMLRDAGLAANTAGQSQGYQVFDVDMHREAMRRLMLEPELERAIAGNQLILHYQPIVDFITRRIAGFEALVRWQHPERGMVPPDEFIGLAEETGQIVPIGTFVLETACRRAAHWNTHRGNAPPLSMGVNVSARQFVDPDFPDIVARACENAGLDRNLLKLELTETAVIDNIDMVERILQKLQAMSVRVVLDDFGTGYCSLTYLHRFPFDTLKVDKSFTSGIQDRTKNRRIVHSTVMLAHRLGMDVVAEGIEHAREAEVLQQMGCEYGQGAMFCTPVPAEEAGRRLAAEKE
jgi:diguanylate cyclase (GGDEF)-like protein